MPLDEIDLPSEQQLKLFLHVEKISQTYGTSVGEYNEHIDVALVVEIVPQRRAEQLEPRDLPLPAERRDLVVRHMQAGQDIVVHKRTIADGDPVPDSIGRVPKRLIGSKYEEGGVGNVAPSREDPAHFGGFDDAADGEDVRGFTHAA